MSIVTFWNGTTEQVGTTSSSIAYATYLSIQHNIKVLLITTSFNDSLINDSFWTERNKKKLSLFGGNHKKEVETNGVVGLDRMIRSNKISPDIITDYAKIVLTNRLEIIVGVKGDKEQYNSVREKYAQIISQAGKYYDMVVVDLDRSVGKQAEIDILNVSDVVVSLVPQRIKKIEEIKALIDEGNILKEEKTVIAIGKYMSESKYNAKNISRSLFKRKEIINTIPYNNLFFEATQEGTVIDLFLNIMRVKEKDINYVFIDELRKLNDAIKIKIDMLKMMR